jgi:hypothetical protein
MSLPVNAAEMQPFDDDELGTPLRGVVLLVVEKWAMRGAVLWCFSARFRTASRVCRTAVRRVHGPSYHGPSAKKHGRLHLVTHTLPALDGEGRVGEPVHLVIHLHVEVQVHIKAIQQIDPRRGVAEVLFTVHYGWLDPRVAKACAQDPLFRVPKDLWKPGLCIANVINEQQCTVHDVPRVRIIDPETGGLCMEFAYTGEVDNPMDLKGFPFDEDSIDIRLAGFRMRDGMDATASDFVLHLDVENPEVLRFGSFITFQFDRHLPEYQLLGVSYVAYKKWNESRSASTSGASTPTTSSRSPC